MGISILRKTVGTTLGCYLWVLTAKLESSRREHGINYCLPALSPLVTGRENQEEERCFNTSSDITGNLVSHHNGEVHAATRNLISLGSSVPIPSCLYLEPFVWRIHEDKLLHCCASPTHTCSEKVAEINRLLWVHWFCLFPYAFHSTGLKAPTEHPVLHQHLRWHFHLRTPETRLKPSSLLCCSEGAPSWVSGCRS